MSAVLILIQVVPQLSLCGSTVAKCYRAGTHHERVCETSVSCNHYFWNIIAETS